MVHPDNIVQDDGVLVPEIVNVNNDPVIDVTPMINAVDVRQHFTIDRSFGDREQLLDWVRVGRETSKIGGRCYQNVDSSPPTCDQQYVTLIICNIIVVIFTRLNKANCCCFSFSSVKTYFRKFISEFPKGGASGDELPKHHIF